jgi:hypothetical protein
VLSPELQCFVLPLVLLPLLLCCCVLQVCIEELKKVSKDMGVKALPYAQVGLLTTDSSTSS